MGPRGEARSLLLFARLPEVGKVKTRLLPIFSAEEAAALHRALLADSLDLLHRAAGESSATAWLYLSERGNLDPELTAHVRTAGIAFQRGNDLGERLAHAFQERLAAGARQVVVLGSDSPHLPVSYIARAFQELERNEVVIGPARDGGYYLLAASRLHPSLFRGIPWGTAQVYRETVRAARKGGISLASLPAWDDIDRPESVSKLWADIRHLEALGAAEIPRSTDRLLREWRREGKRL